MLDQNFWEKYFIVYDILNISIPYQELMKDLKSELNLDLDDVFLDVGSGTGNFMISIDGKCRKLTGIDYSKEGIKIHKSKNPNADVILCDIKERLPFNGNNFSKVISNNVIYTLNVDQQRQILREIYRILKPNGKFVISNVIKNFSPFKIYWYHLKKSFETKGFLDTVYLIFQMIYPTIKMFYYNALIRRNTSANDYHFFSSEEQKKSLLDAGFKNISETKYSYADQAIINSAYKL